MNNRQFLNLVVETYRTGALSLRRIKVANNLFYPSTAAAEAAMARSEVAIKANAKRQAGFKHGLRSLRARATKLGALPAARINFQPSAPDICHDLSFDFVTLLGGDESRILCGDSSGGISLYDADTHSILTMSGLRASKEQDAIANRHQHHPRRHWLREGARQHLRHEPDSRLTVRRVLHGGVQIRQ
ncbi:unnamed protein product [Urochloa humidicola]